MNTAVVRYSQQRPEASSTQIRQAATSLTGRAIIRNSELHGDVQNRHAMQRFIPRTTAVHYNIGNGSEMVGVSQAHAFRKKQKKQQQQDNNEAKEDDKEDTDDDNDLLPAFARHVPSQERSGNSGMRAQLLDEVNGSFVTNSNKNKRKHAATHRQYRNGLTLYNPAAENGEEEDEEDGVFESLGGNNISWSPSVASQQVMVSMGFALADSRDALAMFGGDVNRSVNYLASNMQQHQYSVPQPQPFAAALPVAAAATAAPPTPNKAIVERTKKVQKAAFAGSSPRAGQVFHGVVNQDPAVQAMIECGIEMQMPTQEHYENIKEKMPKE